MALIYSRNSEGSPVNVGFIKVEGDELTSVASSSGKPAPVAVCRQQQYLPIRMAQKGSERSWVYVFNRRHAEAFDR